MKKFWLLSLALLVFATGCKEKAEDPATTERLEKIKAAIEKSNNAPRQAVGIPETGDWDKGKPKDVGEELDEKVKPEDTPEAEDGDEDGDAGAPGKTETSAKLKAKTVLDEAIAAAKSENKALFVHFTADW